MGFPLLTTEQVGITASATDAAGDPDPNAVFTFASADNGIITVTDLGGGNAEVVAQGVGTTQVVVTVTDPSGNSISASADVDVSAPLPPDTDATAVTIGFGATEPKP